MIFLLTRIVKALAFAMLDAAVPEQQTGTVTVEGKKQFIGLFKILGDYRMLEVALCTVKCSIGMYI